MLPALPPLPGPSPSRLLALPLQPPQPPLPSPAPPPSPPPRPTRVHCEPRPLPSRRASPATGRTRRSLPRRSRSKTVPLPKPLLQNFWTTIYRMTTRRMRHRSPHHRPPTGVSPPFPRRPLLPLPDRRSFTPPLRAPPVPPPSFLPLCRRPPPLLSARSRSSPGMRRDGGAATAKLAPTRNKLPPPQGMTCSRPSFAVTMHRPT